MTHVRKMSASPLTCLVAGLAEVCAEGPGLVAGDPLGGGAVLVVGEHVVVVRVQPRQHRGARRAAVREGGRAAMDSAVELGGLAYRGRLKGFNQVA